KDYQQLRIITAMAQALNWPVEIVGVPTVRERDGLAMSSRNQYLKPDERTRALAISRALMLAQGEVQEGVTQANRIVATMQNVLLDKGNLGRIPVSIDYAAAVDPQTLRPVESIKGSMLLGRFLARRSRLDPEVSSNAALIALFTGVLGARLSHVLENFGYFVNNPREIFDIGSGGLTYYGGFLLAFPILVLYARKKK